MRSLLCGAALLMVATTSLGAQSSLFGVRGLGLPGYGYSARARATGGAFGLIDPESALNPGALVGVPVITATFNATPEWRWTTTPAGTADLRDTRFPLATIGGPIPRTPFNFRISYSSYADKDFALASGDSIILRGESMHVADTIKSTGGLADIGLAGAWRGPGGWNIGAAFHFITGSSRLSLKRQFSDTAYLPVAQQTQLSASGIGGSIGLVRRLVGPISIALMARADGHASIDVDSTHAFNVDLPYTLGGGLAWRVSPKLLIAGQGIFQNWSSANSGLVQAGGVGSADIYQASLGWEYASHPRGPGGYFLRFGGHYGTLPFYFIQGYQPREAGIAGGYGTRLGRGRAGLDFSLEYTYRWDNAGNTEKALLLTTQFSVRP